MRKALLIISLISILCCCSEKKEDNDGKEKMMWVDLSANWTRFSNPDSAAFYLDKTVDCGFNSVVFDIKLTTGSVGYKSEIAPRLTEWKGVSIDPDFDYLETMTGLARERGLKIYVSFPVFSEGHGILKSGLAYGERQDWQTMSYDPELGIVPVTQVPGKAVIFTNPAVPEIQEYERSILCEVVERYDIDGIMLDRCRYDNIRADFSDFSRKCFEEYAGRTLERFPEDIYEWVRAEDGHFAMKEGPMFKLWIEWRASVIYDFFKETREAVKAIKPNVKLAAYTGAWYPSYYEVGVNWASGEYDPSADFGWATPEYKKYALAELLDVYTNGNYYWDVTLDEYHQKGTLVQNETDSKAGRGDHLCVEGACRYSRKILCDRPFIGGMYVEVYKQDAEQFKEAVKMNLRESDGFMLFDIVHIISRDWWGPLKEAMQEYTIENNDR